MHIDNKKTAQQLLGSEGEKAVVTYLEQAGYQICVCNYRSRDGEVDIIASKDRAIAFVEVKARSKLYFNLSQVIMPSKQRRIIAAARYYIFRNKLQDMVYRFDVALLSRKIESLAYDTASWDITYIKDAFTDSEALL